jgi:hypothetical protein
MSPDAGGEVVTGPELKALAAAQQANPYYLAYALATGARSPYEAFRRDRSAHPYVWWNEALWCAQAAREGIPREIVALQDGSRDRHLQICAEQVP